MSLTYSQIQDQARQLASQRLAQSASPAQLAQSMIQLADQLMTQVIAQLDMAPEMARQECAKGCAACCHQMVGVTRPELALAQSALAQLPKSTQKKLRDRVLRTKRKAQNLDQAAWWREKIACPLLDETGACLIHQSRPLPCRAFNSTSRMACDSSLAGQNVQIPVVAAQHRTYGHVQAGLSDALEQAGLPAKAVLLALEL